MWPKFPKYQGYWILETNIFLKRLSMFTMAEFRKSLHRRNVLVLLTTKFKRSKMLPIQNNLCMVNSQYLHLRIHQHLVLVYISKLWQTSTELILYVFLQFNIVNMPIWDLCLWTVWDPQSHSCLLEYIAWEPCCSR